METSTGQSKVKAKASLMSDLNNIQDKNSKEYRDKIRELETALGVKEVNIFGTANRSIFEENLDEMSEMQMQALARRLYIDQSGSKPMLKKRLMKQFDTQNVASRSYFSPQPQQKELFSDEQKIAMNKILNG